MFAIIRSLITTIPLSLLSIHHYNCNCHSDNERMPKHHFSIILLEEEGKEEDDKRWSILAHGTILPDYLYVSPKLRVTADEHGNSDSFLVSISSIPFLPLLLPS
ncbi:hypothetical protein LOAG_01218 [Loa loa]|uniref:Uncharacterized protein n=1 Tax=Loa loa TaxID=7209 RepID=A0A1S0U9G9_LOALO|nr:hypothetical protein LOAG_01218 [Loa loa]EFO27264.1 hypothetical protein LOAG_01218 [Loa loa]